MRRRCEDIAKLVASISIPDPQAFSAGLEALAVAAGELPEAQWRLRWLALDPSS